MKRALSILILLAFAGVAGAEPRAVFRMTGQAHVDMPFELDLVVEGFGEAPLPDQPKLDIPDATVTPLGATPNVSRSIQIYNGQRVESATVTWVLRYRIEAQKAGQLRVPSTIVSQGTTRAIAQAGNITVDTIPSTADMKLALELPDRAVFVGETVPVKLVWLFRAQPEDQNFVVPLLASPAFSVSAPPVVDKQKALQFTAGTKELAVPYVADTVTAGGVQYTRIAFQFFIAPLQVGKVEVLPSKVVAALAVGRRDFFGNAATKPFRAADSARTLDVKPLPETDRPARFAGAVGEQYSISVKTSRSVVQLGEPINVDIAIKSNQRLDALALGKLDGDGGLPKDKFAVPADPPTGVLSEDGMTKTFTITAQVTGPATEIPAIQFAYFDPAKEKYQTIASDPIALSVKGGSIVGADAVIVAKKSGLGSGGPSELDDLTQVPVDLALSTGGAGAPLGGAPLAILLVLLYAVPLGVFAVRTWQHRTRGARADRSIVRTAKSKLDLALERAGRLGGRETIGPLVAALRELARVAGREPPAALIGKLETAAFAPTAADLPIDRELRDEVARLATSWVEAPRAPASSAAAVIVLIASLALPSLAEAAARDEGRTAYELAMGVADAPKRKAAFMRAEALFAEAVKAEPSSPELLADWGNAALGAGDVATATLAYRRALAIDGGTARARQNLQWLRQKQPDAFQPTTTAGAADSLLFFHAWPRGRRLVIGAIGFAAMVLVLVPWSARRRRGLLWVAALPLAIWIAMLASVLFEDRRSDEAIVMEDVVLRAADMSGAPAAFNQSVPRGAEVSVLEQRGGWARVRIATGTVGWVQRGTIETIAQ